MENSIYLEYDLVVPPVGQSSEKLGYLGDGLSGNNIVPGDVYGIVGDLGTVSLLEMLYDEYLTFNTLSNRGDYTLLESGQKLVKICSILL